MDVQYQYRFLDVVIRKGEIAIWNKRRVAQSQKLFRKKYQVNENPNEIAENFIDQYWREILDFNLDEENWQIVKGLQQRSELRDDFIRSVFDAAARYQKIWAQKVYFSFALTSNLKVGKSAKPNFYLESQDKQYQITFSSDGLEVLDESPTDHDLHKDNRSALFSIDQLKKIWLIY